MNITETLITTKAEATTESAQYRIEYLTQDENLIKVEVSISTKDDEPQSLGYIIYDGGNIHCSLPGDRVNSNYFKDFETFLSNIQGKVSSNK